MAQTEFSRILKNFEIIEYQGKTIRSRYDVTDDFYSSAGDWADRNDLIVFYRDDDISDDFPLLWKYNGVPEYLDSEELLRLSIREKMFSIPEKYSNLPYEDYVSKVDDIAEDESVRKSFEIWKKYVIGELREWIQDKPIFLKVSVDLIDESGDVIRTLETDGNIVNGLTSSQQKRLSAERDSLVRRIIGKDD